ncbi:MAG: hypothetical protein ACD_3C00048G0002 [uncultured bacterium (gcode 4)]|uniref:Uncharacterized protein n=1 Tax=uncultured bacterium (gcode 4) TaxID=1234023 RepID=K2G2P9_9BACT|nr:MAG: hypothetical protein ACD_3C00048G0002 [uncultured bacterium (gcode 4)]
MLSSMKFEEVLLYLVVALIILLALRDILCWYWKINEWISLLEENSKKQDKIIDLLNDSITAKTKNDASKNNVGNLDDILKDINKENLM